MPVVVATFIASFSYAIPGFSEPPRETYLFFLRLRLVVTDEYLKHLFRIVTLL